MVQRRVARYVCNRWHNTSSVTGILSQLEWVPLATRRAKARLCMMYRVAHTPVGDPWTPWLADIRAAPHSGVPCVEICIPISTSHAHKLSFLPRTIIAWNQLPSIMIIIAARQKKHSVRDASLVCHNPPIPLALVQCTQKSHRLLYTPPLHSL